MSECLVMSLAKWAHRLRSRKALRQFEKATPPTTVFASGCSATARQSLLETREGPERWGSEAVLVRRNLRRPLVGDSSRGRLVPLLLLGSS